MTDGEAEAAAELLAINLSKVPVIDDCARNGTTVSFTTHGKGMHLLNFATDYDYDVHLVCEPGIINSGPLAGQISDDATVYANMAVHGIEDDWTGVALPTHAPKRDGPVLRPREDISDHVLKMASLAGLDLVW
jgi:hypothetical protein